MTNYTYPLPNGSGWSALGKSINGYTYDTFGLSVLIVVFSIGLMIGLRRSFVDGVTLGSFFFLLSAIALTTLGWVGANTIMLGMGLLIISAILNLLGGTKYGI